MTRKQILELESVRWDPPRGFTGLWRGQQYYRGRKWYGPANLVGAKSLRGHRGMYEEPEARAAQ